MQMAPFLVPWWVHVKKPCVVNGEFYNKPANAVPLASAAREKNAHEKSKPCRPGLASPSLSESTPKKVTRKIPPNEREVEIYIPVLAGVCSCVGVWGRPSLENGSRRSGFSCLSLGWSGTQKNAA